MKKGRQEKTRLQHISRNALFSSGGWGVSVVLAIIVTPYMVTRLTLEGYGIYALISGLIGYFGLLDIGLGQGIVKIVAEHHSAGNIENIYPDLNTSLTVQAVTGIAGAAILFIYSGSLINLLNIPPSFMDDALFGMKICAVGFFFSILAGTLGSVLMGLQRYDLTSKSVSVVNSLTTLAIVSALVLGNGIRCAISITAASGVVMLVVYVILVKRLLPSWAFYPTIKRTASSRRLFSFSFYILLMNISGFITIFFTRFVISHYLGPGAVTYYVVSTRVTSAVGGLLSNAFSVIYPVFSELSATSNKTRLKASFYDSSRLFASISFPLHLILALSAAPFLVIWMGKDFADNCAAILATLSVACLVGSLTTVINHFIIGTGHTRPRSIVSIVVIVFNIIVMPFATIYAGVMGLVVTQFLANILALTILLIISKHITAFPIKEYLHYSFSFHLLPFVTLCSATYVTFNLHLNTSIVLSLALFSGVVYVGVMVRSGWLPVKRLTDALRG